MNSAQKSHFSFDTNTEHSKEIILIYFSNYQAIKKVVTIWADAVVCFNKFVRFGMSENVNEGPSEQNVTKIVN